jgi:hypothetical protein
MNREELEKIPRQEAAELLASIPAGPGYERRLLIAIECALNLEWWRGYYAVTAEAPEPNIGKTLERMFAPRKST